MHVKKVTFNSLDELLNCVLNQLQEASTKNEKDDEYEGEEISPEYMYTECDEDEDLDEYYGYMLPPIPINDAYGCMNKHIKEIKKLFQEKTEKYASAKDVFSGIKTNATRTFGKCDSDSIVKQIAILKDKHDVAILQKGVALDDAKERLYDIILYSFLALVALDPYNEEL